MRKRKPRKYQVFLSHATSDKWLATLLCSKIEELGAKTFRDDRHIDGGEDIPDAIRAAIDNSDEMVLLLTPVSVKRPWVLMEAGAAWQRGIRIVAVLQHIQIEPIPSMLKSKKVYDLNEFELYLDELQSRVKVAP